MRPSAAARTTLRVAFATCGALPDISEDDRLLRTALASLGVAVDAMPWDADVDWSRYDAVLPRSTWDYHLRLPEFDAWLTRVDAAGVRLVNPLGVLRWNMTKRYLAQLDACGVAVIPTAWVDGPVVPSGGPPMLSDIATAHGWHGALVVKPVVSASASDTWVAATRTPEDEQRFQTSLARAHAGLMVQPFLPEIERDGEWSLIWVAGQFSHAVVKRPAAGDFRVQLEHGGFHETASPSPRLVEDGARVVTAAARLAGVAVDDILYARIDGVSREGRLLLMECEMLEPALHLAASDSAASALAGGIHAVATRARESLVDRAGR